MIIMALDHTRDMFHIGAMTSNPLAPDTTTPALYFTRWITHLCAPNFVLLSGLSAFLSSQKKNSAEASLFLINRGIWLIFVEVVIVTFGLTFDPLFRFIILQVIWAIGWSMILLAIARQLNVKWVLAIGLILVLGHDLLDYANLPKQGTMSDVIKVLFTAFNNIIPINSTHIIGAFYAILPWTGVMFIGYAIGYWFTKEYPAEKRKRNLLVTGLSMISLFIILRFINKYGDPSPRVELGNWRSFLSFMNVSKYPPSLLYCCATIGPALVFLSLAESIKAKWSQVVSVYGRVPFFYYILHFYILHSLLTMIFLIKGYSFDRMKETFIFFRPVNFGYNIIITYIIWLSVVAVLYFPCRWFYKYKTSHKQWWLSYL